MTSFTFTAEQVRSAPPEVRRWMESQIAAALGGPDGTPHRPEPAEPTLAACTPEMIARLLRALGSDTPAGRVLLELGREAVACAGTRVSAVGLAELARRLRLGSADRLVEAFGEINQAFRQLDGAGEAALFGFDQAGHVYLHQATQHSILHLWDQLMGAAPPAPAGEPGGTAAPQPPAFSRWAGIVP